MSMHDPVADMLTRIRNANVVYHEKVDVPNSRLKEQVARILEEEGFIKSYKVITDKESAKTKLRLYLKYEKNKKRVISGLKRISKPGLRVYKNKDHIDRVFGGLGISVLTTSKGVMTGKKAKKLGIGGEVLCQIW